MARRAMGKWLDDERDARALASGILLSAADEWNAVLAGRTPRGLSTTDVKTPELKAARLEDIRAFLRSDWARTLGECCAVQPKRLLARLEKKYEQSALKNALEGRN